MKLKLGNQYIIPLTGLKDGEHSYQFLLEGSFFKEYPILESNGGKIEAHIMLEKTSNLFILHILLSGVITIQCDRCLDYFDFPVEYQDNFFIKFAENPDLNTDEVICLHPGEDQLVLDQVFMECTAATLPLHKSHSEKEDGTLNCNETMIELLEKYSDKEKIEEDVDPRWSKLKDLYKKDNNNS